MTRTALPASGTASAASIRERIIEAASQLFRESGYDVPMDAIAQAANVSKQSLYNHFGSKDDLFRSIISLRAQALRAPLLEADAMRPPREVLLEFARQYHALALSARGTGFIRMMVSASQRFPGIGSDLYAVGPGPTLEALAAWIARQHDRGSLVAPQPRLAAEHFVSMLYGPVLLKGLLGVEDPSGGIDPDARAAFCVEVFMRGMGAAD